MAALTQAQRDALTAAALIVDQAHAKYYGEAIGSLLGFLMIAHVGRAMFHSYRRGMTSTNIGIKLLRFPSR